jgi:NAD(P)-dependent dehydrogenase (short-subunit alcohol dehydrogenase family)
MKRRFEGRRVVVTGASRGIGAAVSRRLAAEGASVALVARTLGTGDDPDGSLRVTQALCERHGGTIVTVVADLTDDAARARVIPESVEGLGGPIEILINNAAAAIPVTLSETTVEQQRTQFEANVVTPLCLAQSVVPAMRVAREGWIVNLSSVGADLFAGPPFPRNPVGSTMDIYGATKAALNRITNGLAVELFGTGIRVNTVQPRIAVMTEGMRAFADKVGPGVFEELTDTVEAIVSLCDCAPERTGQVTITLDLLAELALTPRGLDGEVLAAPNRFG